MGRWGRVGQVGAVGADREGCGRWGEGRRGREIAGGRVRRCRGERTRSRGVRWLSTRRSPPRAPRALAVHSRSNCWVVAKESAVGALCGLVLGVFVLAVGVACRIVSFHVGVVVCISLPLVRSLVRQ